MFQPRKTTGVRREEKQGRMCEELVSTCEELVESHM
jgi:hypothetical protein